MLNQEQLDALEILKGAVDKARDCGLLDCMSSNGVSSDVIESFCNDVNLFSFNAVEKLAESTLSKEISPSLSWDDFDSVDTLAIGDKPFDVGEPAEVPKACSIDNPSCESCQ
jgi:hypothetical protein